MRLSLWGALCVAAALAGCSRPGRPVTVGGGPSATAPAPGSPAGITVWVNTSSGVYHYAGSRWYGGTREGRYMSEDDARSAGYRPAANGQ